MTPQPVAPQALITIALLGLIAWRLYRRIRRTIGRQRLSRVRPWVTVVVFPLLVVLLGLASYGRPLATAALGAGVAAGIALGIVGLRLTRFEVLPEGRFYTPSAHLGIALSTLLVCRIVYRFSVRGFPWTSTPGASTVAGTPRGLPTPLTLLLIGTLAGYYTSYAIGLLRWSLRTPLASEANALPPDQRS